MQKPKPYIGTKPYLFISYRHLNEDDVFPVIQQLIKIGFRVWYDDGIQPTKEYRKVIADRIHNCTIFVSFVTKEYLSSDFCLNEIAMASKEKKQILNIYLKKAKMTNEFLLLYEKYQGIERFRITEQEFFQEIMKTPNVEKCMECKKEVDFKGEVIVPVVDDGGQSDDSKIMLGLALLAIIIIVVSSIGEIKYAQEGLITETLHRSAVLGSAGAKTALGDWFAIFHDYEDAVYWYQKAANRGNANAQYNLGICYYNGYGIEQDYVMAVEYFQKAADQEKVNAQNALGICYYNGYGIEQDYAMAVEYFQKAADQKYADAQKNLGDCYSNGNGVVINYEKAAEWYQKASNQNYKEAQISLGDCYYYGRGTIQSYEKAAEWYQKAADQGNEDAKNKLENMKENGLI